MSRSNKTQPLDESTQRGLVKHEEIKNTTSEIIEENKTNE